MTWKRREQKRASVANNPRKVYESNKAWRTIFKKRYNERAAARMRRYRQRLNVTQIV